MEPIKAGHTSLHAPIAASKPKTPVETPAKDTLLNSVTKVEQDKVSLSPEGKALLASLQKIENDAKGAESSSVNHTSKDTDKKSVGDKVESFTYGALGMDSPDKLKAEKDSSYSAGQYLSGAITAGAILLALA